MESEKALYLRVNSPRTATEIALARYWSEVLGVETVRVADDFLSLGGDSVAAMQVASRLRRAIKLDIPVSLFFEKTVLADLASAVDAIVSSNSRNPQ